MRSLFACGMCTAREARGTRFMRAPLPTRNRWQRPTDGSSVTSSVFSRVLGWLVVGVRGSCPIGSWAGFSCSVEK